MSQQIKATFLDQVDAMDIIKIAKTWHYIQKMSADRSYGLPFHFSLESPLPSKMMVSRQENLQAALGKPNASASFSRRNDDGKSYRGFIAG